MARLKIEKNGATNFIPLRNNKVDSHALKINNQYIDLTTNINLTSFNKCKVYINGSTYYLRDRYAIDSGTSSSGNYHNRAYKPSAPLTHTVSVPINNYPKYKISINGNFDVCGWFDFNNSSYFDNSHFKGNFSSSVSPINGSGHGWSGYDVTSVSEPSGFDMSYPPLTMNGQLNFSGNISSVSTSDQQIFYRQMTNSRGDGVYVNFRVYLRKSGNNLIVTYGWWLAGYDARCNGNASYWIKAGVTTHE